MVRGSVIGGSTVYTLIGEVELTCLVSLIFYDKYTHDLIAQDKRGRSQLSKVPSEVLDTKLKKSPRRASRAKTMIGLNRRATVAPSLLVSALIQVCCIIR